MSKFRAMALKADGNSPSLVASTSSVTLEDHPLRPSSERAASPADAPYVVKMEADPTNPDTSRPPSYPPSSVKDEEDEPSSPLKTEPSPKDEDDVPTILKRSASPSVSPKPEVTPPIPAAKPPKRGPQLIGDLPVARDEAMLTFAEIGENHYQYSTLGRSREALESMTCECPPSGFGESILSAPAFWRAVSGWG